MKELEFQPKRVGFMAWVCQVKLPGKPGIYHPVKGRTEGGTKRKANKAHKRLLRSYTVQSGISTPGEVIEREIPPLPKDAPRWVDTDLPRPSGGHGLSKEIRDDAVVLPLDKVSEPIPMTKGRAWDNLLSSRVIRGASMEMPLSDNHLVRKAKAKKVIERAMLCASSLDESDHFDYESEEE